MLQQYKKHRICERDKDVLNCFQVGIAWKFFFFDNMKVFHLRILREGNMRRSLFFHHLIVKLIALDTRQLGFCFSSVVPHDIERQLTPPPPILLPEFSMKFLIWHLYRLWHNGRAGGGGRASFIMTTFSSCSFFHLDMGLLLLLFNDVKH